MPLLAEVRVIRDAVELEEVIRFGVDNRGIGGIGGDNFLHIHICGKGQLVNVAEVGLRR